MRCWSAKSFYLNESELGYCILFVAEGGAVRPLSAAVDRREYMVVRRVSGLDGDHSEALVRRKVDLPLVEGHALCLAQVEPSQQWFGELVQNLLRVRSSRCPN